MNVAASGTISVSGPLSRNFEIKKLVPGDVVEVKVLKMLGDRSAVVDLKGNKVQLDFTSPPQKAGSFILELVSSKNDRLTFRMKNSVNEYSDIQKYLQLSPKDASPSTIREILKQMQAGVPGMFSLNLMLSGAKGETRGRDILPLLKYLMAKGMSSAELSYASAVLSGFKDEQASLIEEIVGKYEENDSSENQETGTDDSTDIKNFPPPDNEKHEKTVFYTYENSLKRIDFFVHGNYFSGRVELPHVGLVEFFLRIDEKPDIMIVCGDECLGDMLSGIQDLSSALTREYPGSKVRVLPVSSVRKKVLAFVKSMTERSFDARA